MTMNAPYDAMPLTDLLESYPQVREYFSAMGLRELPLCETLTKSIAILSDELLEDIGMDRQELLQNFNAFMTSIESGLGEEDEAINSITVIGGRNKSGEPEQFTLQLHPGEVTCIVGPTGSGKSRFLADIEWLAQGDSPTGRKILINDKIPDHSRRYAVERKLVAQLSQNMNFVMDLSAHEFITMHAESRMAANVQEITANILDLANSLAGEHFTAETPVTALSGGQSRALMIADVACLSSSPIVLIDEIENAGIDRKRAVALLTGKNKIVLMATHDPILALMGMRRLVFKNGGIEAIIETSHAERLSLGRYEEMDRELNDARTALRNGGILQ